MNTKIEKMSSTSVVASATVVATRALTSTTTTTASKDIPKSHPKTLDIPGTPSKATISKGDKRSSSAVVAASTSLKTGAHPQHRDDDSRTEPKQKSPATIHPSQFASICREVAQIREEHVAIRQSLSEREGELGKTRVALRNIAQERDFLRNKVSELEHVLKHSPEKYSHIATMLSSNTTTGINLTVQSGNSSGMQKSPSKSHNGQNPITIPNVVGNTSFEQVNSINVSLTSRNIFQQQQNQRFHGTPPTSRRPDGVAISSIESPRKCNGNGSHLKKGEQLEKVSGSVIPVSSPPFSNSQESHQGNNNNKKVEQHKLQQQHSTHKVNTEKTKGGYNEQLQHKHLKHRNGNDHNENGNDGPVMTNCNGNNNGGSGSGQQHHHSSPQSEITGLDLMLLGPDCSTKVVEHLVHPMAIESSVREIQHTLVLKGVPMNGERLREVEIEIDRLNSRIDHLRSQNDVITLNLEDAKSHADRLTVLLGKYESNNVALQLALRYSSQASNANAGMTIAQATAFCETAVPANCISDTCPQYCNSMRTKRSQDRCKTECTTDKRCKLRPDAGNDDPRNQALDAQNSDQMSDAYEVLVALLETELGQVITNIHAAGHLQSIFSPAIVSRSGNNNNSSDNSPSELLPCTSPSGSHANINSEQTVAVGGENGQNNNNDNNHDNNNAIMVMSGKHHQQDKTLDISTSTNPSSSTLHLVEQAKRNRLTAETAARLLLTRFSTQFEQVVQRSGYENNNLGRQQQHVLFPDSPCESHSSSTSASNLSNISGESGQSLSPCADDEQGHIQSVQTPKVEIGNEKIVSSSDSPTSSTFRVSNGNGPNGYPSILTTLLPLLGHQKHGSVPSSPSVMGMESGIRHLISRLKSERDAVKQTVMELESESLESLTPSPKPSSPYYPNGSMWSPADARKMDLETAVLMQELMAMKEERAELRAQLFLLEKEKASLELRLRSHESQEEAYKVRINYLKSEIMDCKTLHSDTYPQQQIRNRNDIIHSQQQQHLQTQTNGNNKNLETMNNNNNNQNVNWERETALKKRIHELATTLEKVTNSTQVREKQNQEMINELNRANGILMQTLDVAKKKYQNRIKKMEDQIVYVSERHAAQLRLFGERLPPAAKFHA